MWTTSKRIALGLLIVVAVFILSYSWKKYSPNRNDAKLYEVRQLYSQLTLPPGFTQTNSDYISKVGVAEETKYFSSDRSYREVKDFIVRNLIPGGWTLVQERTMTDWGRDFGGRQLRFRKGDYWIVIEYAGEKANDDWNYAITVEWKS